jgi:hypothetical protein
VSAALTRARFFRSGTTNLFGFDITTHALRQKRIACERHRDIFRSSKGECSPWVALDPVPDSGDGFAEAKGLRPQIQQSKVASDNVGVCRIPRASAGEKQSHVRSHVRSREISERTDNVSI